MNIGDPNHRRSSAAVPLVITAGLAAALGATLLVSQCNGPGTASGTGTGGGFGYGGGFIPFIGGRSGFTSGGAPSSAPAAAPSGSGISRGGFGGSGHSSGGGS